MKSSRKILILLFLLIFIKSSLFAQQTSFFTILQYYNEIKINAVSTLGNGDHIMVGTVKDRNDDILLAIFDQNGSLKWHRFIDFYDEVTNQNTLDEGLNILDFPEDSAFVVLGSTLAGENTVILKFSYKLNLQWSKWIKAGFNYSTNLFRSGSNVFVLGSYATINDRSMQKPFIFKLDKDGNELWKTNFDLTGWSSTVGQVSSMVLNTDGSIMLTGIAKETPQSSIYYQFLAKLDADGNVLWTKTYDSFSDGNTVNSIYNDATAYYLLSPYQNKMRINTINASGSSEKTSDIDLEGLKYPKNFIYAADTFYAASNPVSDSIGGYFLKIAKNDNKFIKQAYNVSNKVNFDKQCIASTLDGSFIISGNIFNLSPDESFWAFIIKLDQNGKSLLEPSYDFLYQATDVKNKIASNGITILKYSGYIKIHNNKFEKINYELVNASGNILTIGVVQGLSDVTINKKYKSGVYFIHYFNAEINETKKINF